MPARGIAARYTSVVSLRKTLITPGSVTRTAYGSVCVSPITMRSSSSASPAARLNAIAPAPEPGQTSTAMSSVRCGPASTACDSVA